jgi:hypothetical protein
MEIKQEIFNFVSIHEMIISNDMNKRDENIKPRFTTFGNKAGCRAVHDILDMLDDDTKINVLKMMRNKRVL